MVIGDLAPPGQVWVRLLHHDDHTGLLKPGRVDAWNSHRSCSPEQLSVLNRLPAVRLAALTGGWAHTATTAQNWDVRNLSAFVCR